MDTGQAAEKKRSRCGLDGNGGDYWLFYNEFHSLVDAVRREERERAAKIVEDWPVDTNYIVGKIRLESRRSNIAGAIRGHGKVPNNGE